MHWRNILSTGKKSSLKERYPPCSLDLMMRMMRSIVKEALVMAPRVPVRTSLAERERPSVEERAISEDEYESLLLAEEDDFRRREAAQKAAKLIECTHAPSVLSECRNILRVAVQLRLPHLCSLVLARIKSLITPATVIAVAEMAHSVVESEMTKGASTLSSLYF